ncbi:MAG: bifunctional UDP-N-acetylglucosamine diphosphorylase/glucosamine-1-phosphate N-acetyltransferase GlmU [bacterium]|nr:bifunctional UDP-N-acetylglucosamine diphosphorylase/glucosamine-1-phosphate N-acetyltransferase GlmU [bacterium]
MPHQTKNSLVTIILAAGKGTRMKTSLPKVLHTLRGRPLLEAVLDTAANLGPGKVIVISGHGADTVRSTVGERAGNHEVVIQEPQLGTGHAVFQCLDMLTGFEGTVLVLSGDVPNLKPETVKDLARSRIEAGSDISILTGHLDNPSGYGRIIRTPDGKIIEIREQRDLSEDQESIKEVNLGVYAFDAAFLTRELPNLSSDNAQGEYYLTDLAKTAAQAGNGAASHTTGNHSEALGINTLRELSGMEMEMNRKYLNELMDSGVRIIDPDRTWIDDTVSIEPDAVIHPTVFLYGHTKIGAGTVINPGAVITDSTVGRGVLIKPYCVITGSTIDDSAEVGPFAHMRPGSEIRTSGKIGNFVETKQAVIGVGSKVSHLSYVGDAELGPGVNIGAGCVTCNYDGFNKYKTVIEEGVFVGSGTMMVAPITLGKGSLIAAGSTLTQDVPPDSLAIARSQQSVREGWAAARREKLTSKSKKEKN